MRELLRRHVTRHGFHGDWNYDVAPTADDDHEALATPITPTHRKAGPRRPRISATERNYAAPTRHRQPVPGPGPPHSPPPRGPVGPAGDVRFEAGQFPLQCDVLHQADRHE